MSRLFVTVVHSEAESHQCQVHLNKKNNLVGHYQLGLVYNWVMYIELS